MSKEKSTKKWFPLESNPETMTKFMRKLGLDDTVQYHDVFGFDDALLEMVPTPVMAVLLLYPITKENTEFQKQEEARIEKEGQELSKKLWYTKQTISNACGTIGLLHSVYNNLDRVKLNPGFLQEFLEKTKDKSPEERAKLLEEDDTIEEVHQESAQPRESEEIDMDTNLHFVCFVHHDGYLYELDGRRKFPINKGKSSPQTLLKDAVGVIQQYMSLNPKEVNFSVVAMGPKVE